MKVTPVMACMVRARLNRYTRNPAYVLRDIILLTAFNSGLEVADDLFEQAEAYAQHLREPVYWD